MAVNHILTDHDFSSDFRLREEALQSLTRRITEAAVSTRQALLPFEIIADAHQEAVIKSSARIIRMVAPAGAGKTQTIINRVLHRVQNGLDPARILVLTFDNAAVNSIRLKLRDQLADYDTELSQLRIQTLNAYGYSMLKESFPAEYKRVVESRRQYSLIRELRDALRQRSPGRFASLPKNLAGRYYLEFFSLLKNELFDPRSCKQQSLADFLLDAPQATPLFPDPLDLALVTRTIEAFTWLYKNYERLLRRDRVLDFDDQKLRAHVSLKEHPEILESLQSRLDEVIVDEFQDINRLDFALIQTLAEKSVLVVTGDDDQAIYGFRGCSPDFIIRLEDYLFRPTESHELQINYRCPPVIVKHADRLIRHNTHRIPKTPRAESNAVAQIHVISSLSAGIEAKSIVALIKRVRLADPTIRYKDFVVLYRTNAQSLPLQFEFILNDLPYYVRPEHNVLQNESLDSLLSVLRVKISLRDREEPSAADAARTVASYFRYVEPEVVRRLEAAFRSGPSFWEVARSRQFQKSLPEKGRDFLVSAIESLLAAPSLMETLDVVTDRFYGMRGMVGGLDEVVENRVPLGEVYEIAAGFRGETEEFVQCLDAAFKRARASKAGHDYKMGVPLLTYFRSKGLQWHTVILCSCNEGLIPHERAPVEEERRLFYVAMTRASSNLIVSYVQNVCGWSVPPSRFLYESGLLKKPKKKREKKTAQRQVEPAQAAPDPQSLAADGYVSSMTSNVFHVSSCRFVLGITEFSMVRHRTREEAIRDGKRPCFRCDP